MPKFKFGVTLDPYKVNRTARLADGAGAANQLLTADNGKFVRLVGDSQYGLCAVGNEIEAVVAVADDITTQDGFSIGSYKNDIGHRVMVTFDGLQATPGTGVIALGDYVVTGTVVARGTALPGDFPRPRVCRATAAASALIYKWRVVSLDGTGAVGQTGLIERVA
jgi:hypothetical protein